MKCPINKNNNKCRAIFCDIKKSLVRVWKEPFLYLLLLSVVLFENIQGAIPILLIWVFAILIFYMVKHYFFVKPPAPETVSEEQKAPAPTNTNTTVDHSDNKQSGDSQNT